MKINNILESIGNTPVIKLNNYFSNKANVWMKIERFNPGGSIKDRIALAMINKAEEQGILKNGSVIVEPTSGNTGVGLAMVAAVKGYKLILVMPESMSIERRNLMAAYGAEFVLTPREKGMKGAIDKANEIVLETENAWTPAQFDNEENVNIHKQTTAQEIIKDFPNGIDYLITGVGTGGHISGVAEILKQKFPDIKIIAVEPKDSPVIAGGKPGPHAIQGIGAGFIPKNLNTKLIDSTISIEKNDAFENVKKLARTTGILAGISTGASLAAVEKQIANVSENATILTFNYDTGERYLSIEGLF